MIGTAPIAPPSRTATGGLPKARVIPSRTAAAIGPERFPKYGRRRPVVMTSTSGLAAPVKRRRLSSMRDGSWPCTRRKLTLSSASFGTAVFTPGPV